MKIKIFSLILCLLVLSGLLTACQEAGGGVTAPAASATAAPTNPSTALPLITPTAGPVQTTLTIWHSWNENELAVFQEILKDFQAGYPEVQFDVLYIPRDHMSARLEAALPDGSGPDLFFGPAEWGPRFFNNGLLSDLDGDIDPGLRTRVNPAALETASYQDALVGLPYALQGVVLFRNKAIIPKSAVTFDELVTQAKKATVGEIIGADLERGFFFSGGHLSGVGGDIIGADGLPAFNNEAGIRWLELLTAMENAGPSEFLSDRDLELFKSGRVGWIIDGTWNIPALAEAIGEENLEIDPWPSYQDGSLSGFVRPDNVYLGARTQGPERQAAVNFIKYFLSEEAQSLITQAGLIPSVGGVKVLAPTFDRLIVQAITALANGAAYPSDPEMPTFLGPLDQALQAYFSGGQTPAEALRIAQEAIKASLAQQATGTPAP